ncbi:hypothetical protein F0562_030474 [Nyssa sinensis]|uniref:Retrotransposon Copia-like N-terminal domain-containing protein n=1 Tax=Nyssa sinensis TaxID=561372 RepID=A0A5J5B2V1_9ASTE|nr:hypothetical protein F0562_030474 [Nyssa sinensis]
MPKYGPAFGMATNSSSSSSDVIISSSSSSHQMETPHLPITAHKLNGQNYLQWSQSILMFIRGKEKDDYIIGASVAPEPTVPTHKRWIAENNMVMSWLVNSMTTDIGENFLSFDTVKEIWDMAKETFSDKENTSEIIQIEGILHDLRQGNLTFWHPASFSESPITTENHIPPESFNQPWYQPEFIVDLRDNEHIQEETEEGALSQQTHEAEPGSNPSKVPDDL